MSLELLIIGAGPGGVAAACEASRLGASFALVDATGEAGGTIRLAYETRNIPFLEDRAPGELVASRLRSMAKRAGPPVRATIASVDRASDCLVARSHDGRAFEARCVIVATGTRPVVPLIPGLPATLESPWAADSTQVDAARIAVIGGSDVAFDQARSLRRRGLQTTVLCRSTSPKAPAWLCELALSEGVELLVDARVESAERWGRGVRLALLVGGQPRNCDVDQVVPAAGRVPCLPEGVESLPRLRARVVGDATGRRARHVAIAMGEGCLAAFELLRGENADACR